MTKWRVKYTRNLGEKVYGDKPKDAFRFFDETSDSLGPTYAAYLLSKEESDDCWIVIGQIILLQNGVYILIDDKGEKMNKGTLGRNVFVVGLKNLQPTRKIFYGWIN